VETIASVLAIALLAANPDAAVRSINFDDAVYTRQLVARTAQGNLAEYVKPDETVDNWSTLVAVRTVPQSNDPGAMAAELVKALKRSNPDARFQLLVKEDETEAIVDFITWPADGSYGEFNLFRYIKRPGRPGLISYQFACKVRDTSPDATEQFKQDRHRWIDEMTRADFPLDFED
jgi:hypothetical protein